MAAMKEKIIDTMFEGITPGFNRLSRYIGEVDSPEQLDRSRFSAAFLNDPDTSGNPEKVVHYLLSGHPDATAVFRRAIDYALGMPNGGIRNDDACGYDALRLSSGDKDFLEDARRESPLSKGTVLRVMELIPNILSSLVLDPNECDWELSDERNLSLPGETGERRVVNGWLVHNSDHAGQIYNSGFRRGNYIGYLAYGYKGHDRQGKYGFAYRLDDAPSPGERHRNNGLKYTYAEPGASIVFKGSGVVVDHAGDRERQVIFDISEPSGCFLVKYDGDTGKSSFGDEGWSVYGKNPARPLLSNRSYRECLEWIGRNGDGYSSQMRSWVGGPLRESIGVRRMDAITECMGHIADGRLRKVLAEGYMAIMEGGVVCSDLRPLYRFLVATGDWNEMPKTGMHTTKLKLKTDDDIKRYAQEHLSTEESRSFNSGIPFSGTNQSDNGHGRKNLMNDIKQAYKVACQCEYELKGHDVSKMVWPGKAQAFMDKFFRGMRLWEPPADDSYPPNELDDRLGLAAPHVDTVDGQTFDAPWKAYADKNRAAKMRRR